MIEIEFTAAEWFRIAEVAEERAETKGFKPGWDLAEIHDRNLVGAAGEAAVSRYTGLPWYAQSKDLQTVFSHNDVGHLEVRTRNKPKQLDLGIKPYEFDKYAISQRFVLCWLKDRIITLVGWTTLGRVDREGRHSNQYGITFLDWRKMYDIETVML